MFYCKAILERKGPLGKIWLAAHFDKKLSKSQIQGTNVAESVELVLQPPSPLALRVSGYLLLGIVRIYSGKVKYLLMDCTETLWKLKLAFRPASVNIPALSVANIDDPNFGMMSTDHDYQDLEPMAYPQYMISPPSTDNKAASPPSSLFSSNTSCNSNGDTRRVNSSDQVNKYDEVPPFEDFICEESEYSLPPDVTYEDVTSFPPSAYRTHLAYVLKNRQRELEQQQQQQQQQQREHYTETAGDASVAAEPDGAIIPPKKRNKRKVNKHRVVIDKDVMLPDALIMERMANQAPILRRNLNDPLPFKLARPTPARVPWEQEWLEDEEVGRTMEERLMMPASVRRLAPELQELYLLSTSNQYSLPFPLKDAAAEEARRASAIAALNPPASVQPAATADAAAADDEPLGEETDYAAYSYDDYPQMSYEELDAADGPVYDQPSSPLTAGGSMREFRLVSEAICRAVDVSASTTQVVDSLADRLQLNERAKAVLGVLKAQFGQNASVSFENITSGVNKRTAASCLLEILLLKTHGLIDAVQKESSGDIVLSATKNTKY